MRLRRYLGITAAATALVLAAPPAHAADIHFFGEISGNAVLNIPTDGGCSTSTYQFGALQVLMAVTDGTDHYAGSLSTSNVTGTGTDCGLVGTGNIGTAQSPHSFFNSAGSTNGTFYGTFVRIGAKVDANLTVRFEKINGATKNQTVNAYLDVTLFVPTGVSPSGSITAASFVGEFHTDANAPGADTVCATIPGNDPC